MKQVIYSLFFLIGVMVVPVHAASFDCDKAASTAEKLVCNLLNISKIDDELGTTYQEVLGKANDEQKQRLLAEQKHWLNHTRNICTTETWASPSFPDGGLAH